MRRLSRRTLARLAGGALLALSSACRPAPVPLPTVAPPTPSPTPAARLKLGAVVDLRAEGQSDGLGRWQGAQLGVEMVNADGGVHLPGGTRMLLELLAYEVNERPDAIPAVMQRLSGTDGALAIVADGGAFGDAVRRQADQLAIPTLMLDDRPSEGRDPVHWTFALGASDVEAVTQLVTFLAAHGIGRVGWIAPRTATAGAVRNVLVAEAARTTLRVVAEEGYAVGGEPPPEALARLAFAGAEVILGWPSDVAEATALTRAAAERARGSSLYLGPVAATPTFLARVGQAAEGVRTIGPRLVVPDFLWDSDPLTVPTRQFLNAFRQRFGATPSIAAATAWDAVRISAAALARSGADRAGLRDAIGRTQAFSGASGPIDLAGGRRNGLDGRAFVVARAERGAWVLPP